MRIYLGAKSKDCSLFSSKKNPILRSFIPTITIRKEIKTIKMKMTYYCVFVPRPRPVDIPWLNGEQFILTRKIRTGTTTITTIIEIFSTAIEK